MDENKGNQGNQQNAGMEDRNREKQQGGNTPSFLRTHPTDAKRIQQLQVWMPEAMAQYHPAQ